MPRRAKIIHGVSWCASLVLCVVAMAASSPAEASIELPPACCERDEDGALCHLYLISGPPQSTYQKVSESLIRRLVEPAPEDLRLAIKVLCSRGPAMPLRGSVHNLVQLWNITHAREPDRLFKDAELVDDGCDVLTAEDLPYIAQCSMALAQADVAQMASSGTLQVSLLREHWAAGEESTDADSLPLMEPEDLEKLCAPLRRDDAGVPGYPVLGDEWRFVRQFACAVARDILEEQALEGWELRSIASLYKEPLQVIFRYPADVTDLVQLKNFRVYVGPPGSGSRLTTMNFLAASGMRPGKMLRFSDAIGGAGTDLFDVFTRMRNQDLDAIFVVSAAPFEVRHLNDRGDTTWPMGRTKISDLFGNLLQEGTVYVKSLPTAMVLRLTDRFPLFSLMEIPSGTYPGQTQAINTVGVSVHLVTTADFPGELVHYLLERFLVNPGDVPAPDSPHLDIGFAGWATLEAPDEEGGSEHSEARLAQHSVPFHDAVGGFLTIGFQRSRAGLEGQDRLSLEIHKARLWTIYVLRDHHRVFAFLALIGLVLLLGFSVPRWRLGVLRRINSHPILSASMGLVFLLLVAGTITFISEQRLSDFFSNPAEAVFSVMVYLLSGFEDRAPVTFFGRVGSSMILFVSPLMIALLTGIIVRGVQRQISEGYVIPRRLKNHYVICGWNERAVGIVLQLRDELFDRVKEQPPIVIVGEPQSQLELERLKESFAEYVQDVRVITRPPTSPTALCKAHVARARAIVVLADGDEDGQAAMVLAAIRAIRTGWRPQNRTFLGHVYGKGLRVAAMLWYPVVRRFGAEEISSHSELANRWLTPWKDPTIVTESVSVRTRGGRVSGETGPGTTLESFQEQHPVSSRFEVLRCNEVRGRLFAQAARVARGGLVSALFQLLTFDLKSNEAYTVRCRDLLDDDEWSDLLTTAGGAPVDGESSDAAVPFQRVVAHVLRRNLTQGQAPVIPVARRAHGARTFDVNPVWDTQDRPEHLDRPEIGGLVLRTDDVLVLAYQQPRRKRRWRR